MMDMDEPSTVSRRTVLRASAAAAFGAGTVVSTSGTASANVCAMASGQWTDSAVCYIGTPSDDCGTSETELIPDGTLGETSGFTCTVSDGRVLSWVSWFSEDKPNGFVDQSDLVWVNC